MAGHSPGLTCLLPSPAHLQPGPCQRGDRPGQVPTRAQPCFRQHRHRWVVFLRMWEPLGCVPGMVPMPASWVFLQVGSCTPASRQISWDAIPVFSAAWGPAPPCARRWTSAYCTVTASLCPSISPSRANARNHKPCGGQSICDYGPASSMPAKSRERHQGSKVWGWSWLASSPSMDWGLEVLAVPSLPT